ncbi:hypothetical protein [Burkholderia sp. EMB26]|uniref:hypothetical protein n=1 Tax=Burkholderia sp. EMB26 TaxID=2854261 RepID=UPI00215B2573|nr:hypothetical protein [Burkholderia sp. EMB26]UVE55279.1 hypothetical protein KU887_06295 [Burkholderia sp. EMB26]
MSEIKHTPGPWRIIEREILEDGGVYPRHIVGGDRDTEVCMLEGSAIAALAAREPHGIWGRNANGDLIAAAPDMAEVLELLAAEADSGKVMIPSDLRLTIDTALIKAGRKAAPEPVRVVTIAGVDRDPPRYCSFCFEADCNGECSGDGAMGD